MADIVEVVRKAQAYAGRPSAIHKTDAEIQDAQRKADPHSSDIIALPCDLSQWMPLQDSEPTSSTYGAFYQIEGYSREGQDVARPGS